jgi:3-hydroxyacyl-[acyl-carrier-protein] dehydratase
MTVCIPAGHPSLPGHFPGRPIVPGVVLLDAIFAELGVAPHALRSVRFMRPVRPGDVVAVSLDGGRFAGRVADEIVVQGVLG